MRGRVWSESELEILDDLVGRTPAKELPKRFQVIAKRKGLLPRTVSAITVKAKRQYSSIKAIDANFTLSILAQILRLNRYRVREWARSGKLKADRVGKNGFLTKITPSALKDFSKRYPHLLSDSDIDGLTFLFGKEKALRIASLPSSKAQKKPILTDTGVLYPSISAASEATGFDKSTIRYKVRTGKWKVYR